MNQNNMVTAEQTTEILKGYQTLKRKAMQLDFEINQYYPVLTGEDMIDTMTFSQPAGEYIHGGQASDKTSRIALSYAEKAKDLNIKHKQELEADLRRVLAEMKRIEFYISILDKPQMEILSLLYLDGMTFIGAAEKLEISISSLKKLRIMGIKQFSNMLSEILK